MARLTRRRQVALTALMAALLGGITSVASCGGDGDDRVAKRRRPGTTTSVASSSSVRPTAAPALATTATTDPELTSTSRLRLDGIGPVRVGMTTDEASRAMGKGVRHGAASPNPASCSFAKPEGGPNVAFMVIDGRIRRVDVMPPSSITTVSGVRIGDGEAKVHRVYGSGLRVEPHPYRPGGRYLVYESPEPSQRGLSLIFETDGAGVTSFRAGERGAVEAPEGCA